MFFAKSTTGHVEAWPLQETQTNDLFKLKLEEKQEMVNAFMVRKTQKWWSVTVPQHTRPTTLFRKKTNTILSCICWQSSWLIYAYAEF